MHDQAAVINFLVGEGADIERRQAYSALEVSALNTSVRAMRALLDHGAAVNRAANPAGYRSPLHAVCFLPEKGVAEAVDLLLRAGADETELVLTGGVQQSLGQLLFLLDPPLTFDCPAAEKERARTLLARAPNDRAWRRRGWLVMLRSRRARRPAEATCTHGCCGHHGKLKAARAEHAGGLGSRFGAVSEALIGLELEGVFRNVLGFL